jgi:hypothetical protein
MLNFYKVKDSILQASVKTHLELNLDCITFLNKYFTYPLLNCLNCLFLLKQILFICLIVLSVFVLLLDYKKAQAKNYK